MSGRTGGVPTSEDAEAPLGKMVDAIRAGSVSGFIPFDRQGQPVTFR